MLLYWYGRFQAGAIATASQAYIHIPGSINGDYGGGHLTDDNTVSNPAAATNQDRINGGVQARGQLFHIQVNTYGSAAIATGFHLVYNQVPCDAA